VTGHLAYEMPQGMVAKTTNSLQRQVKDRFGPGSELGCRGSAAGMD
jgi:hypothetical protein